MLNLEKAPNPLLRPCVRKLWYCRAPQIPHRRERVLPNGCMQIVLSLSRGYLTDCGEDGEANGHLPQAIVAGTRARFEVIDTADMDELAGILFEPGGFAGLFRERSDLFFGRSIALDDVWTGPPLAERLSEVQEPAAKLATLDVLLTQLLHQGSCRSGLVDQALHLFRLRTLTVAGCARSLGVSERRLSQVFSEQVGMGPKMWCRIRRFQTAVQALYNGADIPWAELALHCGYYDQSHFANDFTAFSGINPTTYSARRGRWQNHVPVL